MLYREGELFCSVYWSYARTVVRNLIIQATNNLKLYYVSSFWKKESSLMGVIVSISVSCRVAGEISQVRTYKKYISLVNTHFPFLGRRVMEFDDPFDVRVHVLELDVASYRKLQNEHCSDSLGLYSRVIGAFTYLDFLN